MAFLDLRLLLYLHQKPNSFYLNPCFCLQLDFIRSWQSLSSFTLIRSYAWAIICLIVFVVFSACNVRKSLKVIFFQRVSVCWGERGVISILWYCRDGPFVSIEDHHLSVDSGNMRNNFPLSASNGVWCVGDVIWFPLAERFALMGPTVVTWSSRYLADGRAPWRRLCGYNIGCLEKTSGSTSLLFPCSGHHTSQQSASQTVWRLQLI